LNGRVNPSGPHPGTRIAQARRRAAMNQRELAERLEVRPWKIEQIETGSVDPREWAESLERILEMPRGWLSHPPESPGIGAASDRVFSKPLTPAERLDRNIILGILAVLATIRFFTTTVALLPGAGNFIDIVLLPITLIAVASRSEVGARRDRSSSFAFNTPVLVFVVICAVSVVLNVTRVAPAPTILFVYDFLSPLVFGWAALKIWPAGQTAALSRLIVGLGVLQFFVICLFDLPTFVSSRNPDDIAGTFGGNAYQLVFFLLVFAALVAGIATFEPGRLTARLAPLLFGLIFLVIFLAQYRALLLSTALTVLFVSLLLGSRRGKGVVIGSVAAVTLVAGLAYVSAHYPSFKLAPTIAAVRENPTFFLTARLEPGRDVLSLYGDNALFAVVGAGPGTYSSRAWRTFAEVGDPSSAEGAEAPYASALVGGVAYTTDVSKKYTLPRLERSRAVLGSYAVTSPYSSYLALLAEVGVVGFAAMIFIYGKALLTSIRTALATMRIAAPDDPLPALALATSVSFFLLVQMAFLENWWEVARVTIPSWMMLAICVKEYAAREQQTVRR